MLAHTRLTTADPYQIWPTTRGASLAEPTSLSVSPSNTHLVVCYPWVSEAELPFKAYPSTAAHGRLLSIWSTHLSQGSAIFSAHSNNGVAPEVEGSTTSKVSYLENVVQSGSNEKHLYRRSRFCRGGNGAELLHRVVGKLHLDRRSTRPPLFRLRKGRPCQLSAPPLPQTLLACVLWSTQDARRFLSSGREEAAAGAGFALNSNAPNPPLLCFFLVVPARSTNLLDFFATW